jgi:hypothetical protein
MLAASQTAAPPAWPTVEVPHAQQSSSLNPSHCVVENAQILGSGVLKSGDLAGNTAIFQAKSHHRAAGAPNDWRTIALGMGFRATVDALDPDAGDRVRPANLASIRNANAQAVKNQPDLRHPHQGPLTVSR